MAGEKFRQEAARFTEEYGFRFSIEKHLEGRAILKRSDMDTVRKGRDREALEEYYDTLSEALTAYLESKTYMADGKAYETEDISIRDFVDGFERVMQARYEDGLEEPRTTPRKPYEGAVVNAFMRSLWGEVRRFDKPLPEVWANNVLKKYDSMERMKAITEAADTRLATIERAEDLGENRKDLANLVMVKQAMEKVRAGRGFFWRWAPWNWSRNSEEKEYLASLTAKVEAYKEKGFPVEEVKATSSVLAGAAQRLGSIIAPPKPAAKKKADKSIDKKVDKAPAQKDAAWGLSPEQMKEVYQKEIGGICASFRAMLLKSGDSRDRAMVDITMNAAVLKMYRALQGAAQDFETRKTPETREAAVRDCTVGLFKTAYAGILKGTAGLSVAQRFATAQAITDMMLARFSPAAPGGKYAAYGDNYLVKGADAETLRNTLSELGISEDAEALMNDVKIELGLEKKSMVLLELSENADTMQRSEQIHEASTLTKDSVSID